MASSSQLLTDYQQRFGTFEDFRVVLEGLVSQLLKDSGIAYHSVTGRSKKVDSLALKLERPGSQYTALSDITDLCGIRIITYFAPSVDAVAAILEREFAIDDVNSVDKRTLLDPDRFGYLSLHHVLSLSPARTALAEYRRFGGLKAEVQTRSILQHAWAEIEHDLGYKSKQSLPRVAHRKFARLAGLLEIADDEFADLQAELTAYAASVQKTVQAGDLDVPLDKLSLEAFITQNETLLAIDRYIATAFGATDERMELEDESVDEDVSEFHLLGIDTLSKLSDALDSRREVIERFITKWISGAKHDVIFAGLGLFYLWYVMLAEAQSEDEIGQGLLRRSIADNADVTALARKVLATYKAART